VKLLLDKGADTLVVTDQGETLLHVAARYGDIKMLEMLAGRDLGPLDLDAKTSAGETVYDTAKSRDESSDWQKAFQMLLKSIDDRKSDSLPVGSVGLESSETLVDLKAAQEVFVTTYAASDDGSDSGSELDHFEDALETVV
jgi:ankyrin repeat protein